MFLYIRVMSIPFYIVIFNKVIGCLSLLFSFSLCFCSVCFVISPSEFRSVVFNVIYTSRISVVNFIFTKYNFFNSLISSFTESIDDRCSLSKVYMTIFIHFSFIFFLYIWYFCQCFFDISIYLSSISSEVSFLFFNDSCLSLYCNTIF